MQYADWNYIDSLNTKNGSDQGVISDDRQEIRTARDQVELFRKIVNQGENSRGGVSGQNGNRDHQLGQFYRDIYTPNEIIMNIVNNINMVLVQDRNPNDLHNTDEIIIMQKAGMLQQTRKEGRSSGNCQTRK